MWGYGDAVVLKVKIKCHLNTMMCLVRHHRGQLCVLLELSSQHRWHKSYGRKKSE